MNFEHVGLDAGSGFEILQAHFTLEWFLLCMGGQVLFQRSPKGERPTAERANEFSLLRMGRLMIVEMRGAGKPFKADLTLMRPPQLMNCPLMLVHRGPVRKGFITVGTLERPLPGMHPGVLLQIEEFGEDLSAGCARILGVVTAHDDDGVLLDAGRGFVDGKLRTGEDVVTAVADDNLLVLDAVGHKVHHPRLLVAVVVGRGGGGLVPDDEAGGCVQQGGGRAAGGAMVQLAPQGQEAGPGVARLEKVKEAVQPHIHIGLHLFLLMFPG